MAYEVNFYQAVGLKTMPTYFKKLGVASTQFLGRKAQVPYAASYSFMNIVL